MDERDDGGIYSVKVGMSRDYAGELEREHAQQQAEEHYGPRKGTA